MEIYDIMMLVVLIATTVFGAWKGVAWQIASLASLGASYLVSLRFSEQLAPLLGKQAPWNRFLAMLVLYVITSMFIWLAFRAVSSFIDRVKLKDFDRQIGAIFGAAKGVLFCIAITFFAVTLSPQARDAILHSHSGHYIAKFLAKADKIMPREFHEVLDPYLDKLEEGLDPAAPALETARFRGSSRL